MFMSQFLDNVVLVLKSFSFNLASFSICDVKMKSEINCNLSELRNSPIKSLVLHAWNVEWAIYSINSICTEDFNNCFSLSGCYCKQYICPNDESTILNCSDGK